MLALADEMQIISRACTVAGIKRTHFYEIKEAFERYSRISLIPQPHPAARRMPNQTNWGSTMVRLEKAGLDSILGVARTKRVVPRPNLSPPNLLGWREGLPNNVRPLNPT